jgi:hypothetical protein
MAQVGCPDRRIDPLCITSAFTSQSGSERKSPACEIRLSAAEKKSMQGGIKTRPSAQYAANDLASPGN